MLQSISLIKRIILDRDLEAEISVACLSRKSFCDRQKNVGVKSKAMLLRKLNLRNFSLYRLLFKHFLFKRILTNVKIFKAGIEIFKGTQRERKQSHFLQN